MNMLNNKGYAAKEMIMLSLALALVFGIALVRVSFALDEANDTTSINDLNNSSIIIAAKAYVDTHKDKFTDEVKYIYGSDLIQENYLTDQIKDASNKKIKITKKEDTYEVTLEN